MLKLVNRGVPQALHRLGYTPAEIDKIVAHIEKYDTIEDVEESADQRAAGLQPAGSEHDKSTENLPAHSASEVGRQLQTGGTFIRSGLKPEHLAVFDCAFKAHRGQRSISYTAHLK